MRTFALFDWLVLAVFFLLFASLFLLSSGFLALHMNTIHLAAGQIDHLFILSGTCLILACLSFAVFLRIGLARPIEQLQRCAYSIARGEAIGFQQLPDNTVGVVAAFTYKLASSLAQSARREGAIVDYALDAVWLLDQELKFKAANLATRRLWGHDPIELTGSSLTVMIAPEQIEYTIAEFRSIKELKWSGTFETGISRKDGDIADIQLSVEWSPQEESYFCIASDITARKEADRLKQNFISIVSHDLRTPLTNLHASVLLIVNGVLGKLPDECADMLRIAERSIQRLIRLINQLLDMDRFESGQLQISLEETSFKELVQDTIDGVQSLAEQKEISISIASDDFTMVADKERLLQVLVNLVSNAMNYSPPGSHIVIEGGKKGAIIEIAVKDNGPGIAKQFLSMIFHRFKRIQPKGKAGGTGLGLAICKAIVEAHGGTIGVDSTEGAGSKFWFRLPNRKM
jgi:PAS domain S-box-containing protein